MGCKVTFMGAMSLLAKVLCIIVLIVQSALLDYIIIQLDTKASDAGRYIWIALDSVIVIFWLITMIFSYRFFRSPEKQKKIPTEGFTGKRLITLALKELPFAYVSWLLYAIVLISKINRMFESFAETLTSKGEILLTDTSLKIILSLAGVIFALLAYAHHNEAHNSKYKLLIEKLGSSASLDLLDVIMLLDNLFTNDNRVLLTFVLENTILAFSSICILLPVFPLFALRIISSSDTAKTNKVFPLTLVLNTALYLLFVNIPLLCIRMYLWVHHEFDVTTFLTKNVMAIATAFLDIYMELIAWRRAVAKGDQDHDDAVQMEPVAHV